MNNKESYEEWLRETGTIVSAAEALENDIQKAIHDYITDNGWDSSSSTAKRIIITALEDCIYEYDDTNR